MVTFRFGHLGCLIFIYDIFCLFHFFFHEGEGVRSFCIQLLFSLARVLPVSVVIGDRDGDVWEQELAFLQCALFVGFHDVDVQLNSIVFT